jgi:hypothetical protein
MAGLDFAMAEISILAYRTQRPPRTPTAENVCDANKKELPAQRFSSTERLL